MEIRHANANDIPEIAALLLQVGQVHHQGRPDIFRQGAQKYDEAALLALLSDKNRPFFIAAEENKVLGYGFCIRKVCQGDPVLADHTSLYIDDLCVDEACRGRQIGKVLYAHIRDYAKNQGYHSVTLNVWAFNQGAIRFYENCGMKPQKITMEAILEDL